MKQQVVFIISLSAMVLTANWLCGPTAVSGTAGAPDQAAVSQAHSEGKAGLQAHIDPQTREFTEAPRVFVEPAPSAYPVEDALNYSSEGLEEQSSEIEGGGIMVDLQGRFRNTSVATIDGDGTVSVPCLPVRPEQAARVLDGVDPKESEGGDDR